MKKEVITAGKTHRTGWYFAEDKTFTIPVLLSVGRYFESDNEICGALSKVARFKNVPKGISMASDAADGVDPNNCVATHCTVDGPYGPIQVVKMRDFDFCNQCIASLAHELTHAVRSAFIDRNVYMGVADRACESFAYAFSGLLEDFLDQLEKGDGWAPTTIIPVSGETGCAHNKKGKKK